MPRRTTPIQVKSDPATKKFLQQTKASVDAVKPLFAGPKPVQEAIYKRIWEMTNLPGKAPPVFEASKPGGQLGWSGAQPFANRRVELSPAVTGGIRTLPFAAGRDLESLNILLHEYAHTAQPRMLHRELMEGGADAYATQLLPKVAQKLGIYNPGLTQSVGGTKPFLGYPDFAPWVKQEGPGFVNHQQFGRR